MTKIVALSFLDRDLKKLKNLKWNIYENETLIVEHNGK